MIKLSINRPTILVVVFTILITLGLFSYTQLRYELIPDISPPLITVSTIYPGASPSEIENTISKKIEDALSSLERIKAIRSTSLENFSIIIVNFEEGVNIDLILLEAQRKLGEITAELPQDARAPVLSKFSTGELPIMNIGATAALSSSDFYVLLNERIKPTLSTIQGVAQVSMVGGREREIQVNVRKDRLEQLNVSILQIVKAIRESNLEFPTGRVQNENQQILIKLAGQFTSLDELRELVISQSPFTGAPIKLYEVAEVLDTEKDASDLSRVNGKDAIGILIQKQADANAVEVSRLVREAIADLEQQFDQEQLAFMVANDTSEFTLEAVRAVTNDIILAIILVAVVMILFLQNFRNALIVLLAIPISIITTFLGMYLFDFTFNLMTLLAVTLVVGILVDDSIVVLENIYRHLEQGKPSRQAALEGSKEIFLAAVSITLVLVVVFFPLALTGGIVGSIMQQFALVVVISTLLSLLVSFTITPSLAARYSRLHAAKAGGIWDILFSWFERGIKWLNNRYAKILDWSLNHKFLVLFLSVAMFAGSILLITEGFVGTEFLNTGDRGEFFVQLELPKDATLQENNLLTRQAEAYLLQQKEVKTLFATIGTQSGIVVGRKAPNLTELTVKLIDKSLRKTPTSVYAIKVKTALENLLPGVKINSSEVSFLGGASDTPIQVFLYGVEKDKAIEYADSLLAEIKTIRGTLEPELSTRDGNPEVNIKVDRAKMAELGLSMFMVGATLQVAFNGNTDAKYRDGENEFDINIVLDEFDRNSVDDLSDLTVMNPQGRLIKLRQFANITQTTGPALLERRDRVFSVTVLSKTLGRPSGSIGREIQDWVEAHPPPQGVSIHYGGDLERQADSFLSLGLAFVASFFFVYLIMVALYNSYVYPLVVMFSVPLATIGALLAMALTMNAFNIFTIMGNVMLVGMVSKNAILLVDFANQSKLDGLPTREALVQAGKARLRPILMTTLSLVIALIPIALAKGAGSEWKNGLSWALIGGLTSSTLLTLVVVPIVYQVADNVKGRLGFEV